MTAETKEKRTRKKSKHLLTKKQRESLLKTAVHVGVLVVKKVLNIVPGWLLICELLMPKIKKP